MVNIEPSDFQKFLKIMSMFIGLYAIIFGLLLGTDQPKLKKQKQTFYIDYLTFYDEQKWTL